jgi:hypothetical protein
MPAIDNSPNYGRTFQMGRETEDKTSAPHFFEYLKEMPSVPEKGAKYRAKTSASGKTSNYRLWKGWSGHLVGLSVKDKDFGSGIPERVLIATLQDEDGDVNIELSFYGSYSQDLMKRLLDRNFNPALSLSLSPFAMDKQNGGQNIGISAISGTDTKLAGNARAFGDKPAAPHLEGMPDLDSYVAKGKTVWDGSKQTEWLWDQLFARVVPKLSKLGGASVARKPMPAPAENYDHRFPANDNTDYEDATSDPNADLPF